MDDTDDIGVVRTALTTLGTRLERAEADRDAWREQAELFKRSLDVLSQELARAEALIQTLTAVERHIG
jgi:hypothetical protein